MADPSLPPRMLCVAVDSRRLYKVVKYAGYAAAAGVDTVLVASVQLVHPPVPEGVRFLNLGPAEQRLLLNRVLLSRPSRVLLGRLGIKTGRDALWKRWSRGPRYRPLRPWMHWRAFKATARDLDLGTITHVIIGGVEGWPIAWHVSRHNPDVVVDFSPPADLVPVPSD